VEGGDTRNVPPPYREKRVFLSFVAFLTRFRGFLDLFAAFRALSDVSLVSTWIILPTNGERILYRARSARETGIYNYKSSKIRQKYVKHVPFRATFLFPPALHFEFPAPKWREKPPSSSRLGWWFTFLKNQCLHP